MTTINAHDGGQQIKEVINKTQEVSLKIVKKAHDTINLATELAGTAVESVNFGLEVAKAFDLVGPTVTKIVSEVGLYDGDSGNNSTTLGVIKDELFKESSDPFGWLSESLTEIFNKMTSWFLNK